MARNPSIKSARYAADPFQQAYERPNPEALAEFEAIYRAQLVLQVGAGGDNVSPTPAVRHLYSVRDQVEAAWATRIGRLAARGAATRAYGNVVMAGA